MFSSTEIMSLCECNINAKSENLINFMQSLLPQQNKRMRWLNLSPWSCKSIPMWTVARVFSDNEIGRGLYATDIWYTICIVKHARFAILNEAPWWCIVLFITYSKPNIRQVDIDTKQNVLKECFGISVLYFNINSWLKCSHMNNISITLYRVIKKFILIMK